ncbi:hypothetical protein DBR40_21880 [Pedobacter sp. KBW01]|uniref:hypothetical protein n=1 Tax=Pedobacter sp. KBW01 TaxID=2153364 RepID=UPI000F5AB963|nr:hypothetical protein [Pedobacter sp. KBW01]RQO66803.1 hypothetical protein DBR40_21880 [Pedobacter sp. KBW01]
MENKLLTLKAEDLAVMYAANFSKKDAENAGYNLAVDVFEKGEVEPLHVLSNLSRLKAVIDSAEKTFRSRLVLNTRDSWNGVSFTPKNGAEKLQYSEDPEVAELERKLAERKELVKLATKSKDTIYDSEGVEVPKVSSLFDKSSITIAF